MFTTTNLRILRHKYGISLKELARHCHFSYQYLSQLDLGQINRTQRNEAKLDAAVEAVIASRKAKLVELEHSYQTCRGQLLYTLEVEADEL